MRGVGFSFVFSFYLFLSYVLQYIVYIHTNFFFFSFFLVYPQKKKKKTAPPTKYPY